jgi:hypothetical protein
VDLSLVHHRLSKSLRAQRLFLELNLRKPIHY